MIHSDVEIHVLVFCMRTFIQLNFERRANVLTEKNNSICSVYNFRNAVQGLLFRASNFNPNGENLLELHHYEKEYIVFVLLNCVRG